MTDNQPHEVFLSHNSKDKSAVEKVAVRLIDEASLKVWLDKWNLIPGDPWQEGLEDALNQSRCCVIFIGPGGLSPWHHEEMRAALQRRVKQESFRVIPVLLPGATMPERGKLPLFLSRLTWVDFRTEKGWQDDEAFHRLVCGIKGVEPGRAQAVPEAMVECPYRGLEIFDEEHARFFFGREAMTQHLVEALRKTRFLCVLGPSGSGKSSLARAGLLPQLRAGKLPSSQFWRYVTFKPGKHPVEELALNLAALQKGADQIRAADQLIDGLTDRETALHLFTRSLLRSEDDETQIFILIDQFEEIFTLCQDGKERDQFIKNIRYAGTIDTGRAVILPTMRADFLAKAAESSDLGELLSTNQFIVSPMDKDGLHQAIEKPAHAVGLRFEAGLAERILKDTGDEPGTLPLLEHALLQLFEKRSGNLMKIQAYEQSGGVQGALTQKAEAIFEQLSREHRLILRRMMLRLTQPGEGTADTRRRAAKNEMWHRAEERAAVEKVIYILADERLLITSRDAGGEEQVDVAHEALIRGWPRLGRWINEDREGLRLHHRLTEDSKEWQRRGRDVSYLYQGSRLVQATEWRQNNDEELNELEREFLDSSATRESRLIEEARARQRRELKRARIFAGVLAAAFIAAVTLAWLAYGQRKRAEEGEINSKQLFYAGSMNLAWRAFQEGNAPRGYELLNLFLMTSSTTKREDLRGFDWYYLWRLTHNERITLRGHEHGVTSVALSPDGSLIATASFGKIKLWDANSLNALASLEGHTDAVMSLTFSPDGRFIASASSDKSIRLWHVRERELIATIKGDDLTAAVAFSPDGRILALASWDKTIKLWDVNTREFLWALTGHEGWVNTVAFSPDGRTLASGGSDKTVKLWDVSSKTLLANLTGHGNNVHSVAFSPDGRTLASAGGDPKNNKDSTVKLWDVAGRKLISNLTGHQEMVDSVAFSPDGRALASASLDCTINLWDVGSGQLLTSLKGHEDGVSSVVFAPVGCTLISGSWDKTVKLWDVCSKRPPDVLEGHENVIRAAAFSPDGHTLASACWDKTIKLWDVGTRQLLATLTGHERAVNSAVFSPDGRTLASASGDPKLGSYPFYSRSDNSIRLWDVSSRQLLPSSMAHGEQINAVTFSPDGSLLASASGKLFDTENTRYKFLKYKTLVLWSVNSRKELASLEGHQESVNSVAFSPDGRMLASAGGYIVGSQDNRINLWDPSGYYLLASLVGHVESVNSVAFSPDGRLLASASSDKTIKLWTVGTYELLATLTGHKDSVWSVVFSPDGRLLTSASRDHTIKLWDVRSRQLLASLTEHKNSVNSVAFSPDGRMLASGSSDKTIRLWIGATDAEVAAQRNRP